jgi:hypothetical protein
LAARHFSPELQMTDGTKTMPSGLVNVGGVAAHINPAGGDIARMMESAPDYRLRALREGPNHAIWPFFDAMHGQMAAPLGFTKDAARLRYMGRPGEPDSDYPNKAESFSFSAAES